MSNATGRLEEMLRAEAAEADDERAPDEARLLRHLAATTSDMTPGEQTWVENASVEEMRGFVRALRMGCARDHGG